MMQELKTGDVIRWLRKHKGWNQEQLGERLGVKKVTVQKYEMNEIKNLKIEAIRNLCSTFHVAPWVFLFPELIRKEHLENEKLFSEDKTTMGYSTELILTLKLLNKTGRNKVLDYINDLVKISDYTD